MFLPEFFLPPVSAPLQLLLDVVQKVLVSQRVNLLERQKSGKNAARFSPPVDINSLAQIHCSHSGKEWYKMGFNSLQYVNIHVYEPCGVVMSV